MICPAILDPFQGASYRLVACMHQMLLCPIVSKLFGYVFSSASIEKDGMSSAPKFSIVTAHDDSNTRCQVQDSFQKIFRGTELHNECNVKYVNGKQVKNGCDIGNGRMTDATIPNDSNKKIQ